MATYRSCNNCNNSEDGDRIFQCKECGKVFCEGCCSENWGGPCVVYRCSKPRCEGEGSHIGWIESKSSNESGYNNSDNGGKVYSHCPNCGSVHNKDNDAYWIKISGEVHYYGVYRCGKCNNVSCAHCWDGDGKHNGDNTRCPHCGQPTKDDGQWIILGEIK